VPARATAFGTAPAPHAPRARADAHPHRTLATRAEPKPPPPGRPQSATGAPCGARPHPSSPAQPSPLRRRVRLRRLTTPATRAYPQQQTRALRSLPVEGQHDEALAAPAVDALASAPRHPAAIATWSARPARGAARGDRAARAGGGDRVGSAVRRVARARAARAVAPCQRNAPLGRSRAGMSRPARYANCPEPTETPGNEHTLSNGVVVDPHERAGRSALGRRGRRGSTGPTCLRPEQRKRVGLGAFDRMQARGGPGPVPHW
jgi:hypothetical protein